MNALISIFEEVKRNVIRSTGFTVLRFEDGVFSFNLTMTGVNLH